MAHQQEYWETMKQKYEQKNRTLLKREQALRLKLEAMDAVIGDCGPTKNKNKQPSPEKEIIIAGKSSLLSRGENEKIISEPDDFKSSTCPPQAPPRGQTGFMKCLWGLFGSSKQSSPTTPSEPATTPPAPIIANAPSTITDHSPAPQDVPTKDDKRSMKRSELGKETDPGFGAQEGYNTYRNENCMCNPCLAEMEEKPRLVNTPQKPNKDNESIGSGESCTCSLPSRNNDNNNKVSDSSNNNKGNEDICNCSISSRYSNKDRNPNIPVNTAQSGGICNCDICMGSYSSVVGGQKFKKESCPCNDDKINEINNLKKSMITQKSVTGSPSDLSLKSLDLHYLKNIHDLATQQKELLNHINDLETKAKIYEDVFKEYKNIDFSSKDQEMKCRPCTPCCANTTSSDPDEKTNAQLKLENFLLKNELKDMRLEVRQYLERMEGPMQFKVESERFKCLQLEQKLEEAEKELASVQDFYQKEINSIKMQLCTANTNVYNLTTLNQQLTEDLTSLQNKCTKLEEDLIRQKVSEVETIKSLQAALRNAQTTCNAAPDEECNLHQIARELSKILKECEPCGECVTLPEDLTTAAQMLKNLTDLVGSKLGEGDYQQSGVTGNLQQSGANVSQQQSGSIRPKSSEIPQGTAASGAFEFSIVQEQKSASHTSKPPIATDSQSGSPSQVEQEKNVTGKPMGETVSFADDKAPSMKSAPPLEEKESVKVDSSIAEKASSIRSQPQGTISSKKSHDSGQGDQKSEKSVAKSATDEKSVKSATKSEGEQRSVKSGSKYEEPIPEEDHRSVRSGTKSEGEQRSVKSGSKYEEPKSEGDVRQADQAVTSTPKSSASCKCVKSRKSKDVDQIWPKSDKPIVMKDSSLLETTAVPSKKKCNCSVSKKLKEQAQKLKAEGEQSSKRLCKCKKRQTNQEETTVAETRPATDDVNQLMLSTSERLKLCHHVTASRSKDFLKSETSVKCLKVKENFPFDIDTQVDILNKPPDGVHITTTITDSGTLEVITEGPEGVIETTLIYTNSGNVEVVTEILEHKGKGSRKVCNRSRTPAAVGAPGIKALEAPGAPRAVVSEPGQAPEAVNEGAVEASKSGPTTDASKCLCKACPALPKGDGGQEAQADQGLELQVNQTAESEADQSAKPETDEITEVETNQPAEPELQQTEPEPESVQVTEQPAEKSAATQEVAEVDQGNDKTSNVEPETSNASPEEGANVNVENTNQIEQNAGVAKSLSLSMHVENETTLSKDT